MFKICILTLTFYIHSLTIVEISQLLQLLRPTTTLGFSPNVGRYFPEKSTDISIFFGNVSRYFSKRHFKWEWGCRDDEGLKTKCWPTFQRNVGQHLKQCVCVCVCTMRHIFPHKVGFTKVLKFPRKQINCLKILLQITVLKIDICKTIEICYLVQL